MAQTILPQSILEKAIEDLTEELHLKFDTSELELLRLLVIEWFFLHPCDYKNNVQEIEESLDLLSDYLHDSWKTIKEKKKLHTAEWLRFEILKRRISRLSSDAYALENSLKKLPQEQFSQKQKELETSIREILAFAKATSEQIFDFVRSEVKQTITGNILTFGLEGLTL